MGPYGISAMKPGIIFTFFQVIWNSNSSVMFFFAKIIASCFIEEPFKVPMPTPFTSEVNHITLELASLRPSAGTWRKAKEEDCALQIWY